MNNKEISLKKISNKKKILFSIIILFISIIIILVISEIILRIIPIPGITYNVSKFDTLTGVEFYPNSINFYRNDRGDFVKRKINKWGYFDKNYNKEKNDGYIRIGFFGDSFTQAEQVPLEETFHYIIGDSLKELKVETLSFGVTGFSTFQAYLLSNKWADFFDLDIIVYVFCENDLGNQIESINKEPLFPYPVLKNNQLIVDNSFKELGKNKTKFYYKFFDYLTGNFLVFATISERLKLLFKYGIKVNVNERDRFMESTQNETNSTKYPPYLDVGDNLSLWPDSLRILATNLDKSVLLNWKNQIEKEQKDFLVLYTPKNTKTLTNDQDTWKPWLEKFCLENEIPFIDPTDELLMTQLKGNDVFYDHYTKFGHQAVAETFIRWFLINYKPRQKIHTDN